MLSRDEILGWLREDDAARLEQLWALADGVRRRHVGDAVHLRGLVELSNHCRRSCHYCGLRVPNLSLVRYRMSAEEVIECSRQAVAFGYGTVVLQSGEDPGITAGWVADVVRAIKAETALAVTLSLGERTEEDLGLWREAGADRYLLRFETSNPTLYERIHPSLAGSPSGRFGLLRVLRELGYEVGSGVMVGIPGGTWDDLARDIALFAELDLDMIGVGPFIPHPGTPLGIAWEAGRVPDGEQVPADELTTLKVVALARLVAPLANIPSTTALATLDRARGRELGLERGANVVMPNLTSARYRALYEIYPGKACIWETAEACRDCLGQRIASLGRTLGIGRGDSPNRQRVAELDAPARFQRPPVGDRQGVSTPWPHVPENHRDKGLKPLACQENGGLR